MLRLTPLNGAMPFIVTTPAKQSVEEERNLIRSHVMRGKNRKKVPLRLPSWTSRDRANNTVQINTEYALSVPAKVGSEFSFTASSAEISPNMLDIIWKSYHLEVKQSTLPPEFELSPNQTESSWFEPIWNDAACLHFTVFIGTKYLEFVQGQKESSKTALAHFVKALAILQQRLAGSDNKLSTSDSTILVVIGLTTAATFLGDLCTALKHLRGLDKMITLRGGMSTLKGNRQLQVKIFRVDLGVALGTGCKPLFVSDGVSCESYIASRGRIPISRVQDLALDPQTFASDLGQFVDSLDIRLRLIWDDLSEISRVANTAAQCRLSFDCEVYQEVMVSIHYRLVHLRFDMSDVNETIRLALLAFASTMFLSWGGIKARYEYLAYCLENALSLLRHRIRAMPIQLILWIYVICAVSVFDEREQIWFQPSLRDVLRFMRLESWDEVGLSLKSVLWVNVLHDPSAKQIVEATLPHSSILESGTNQAAVPVVASLIQ